MLVPELLLETLEELLEKDFKKLQWYLSLKISDSYEPIPKSRLERACHTETVSRMIESYGEESAVKITVEILKKMNFNNAAAKLQNSYAEGNPAATFASSSAGAAPHAAAPATMLAQQGSVIIAPIVAGGTSGSWNVAINK